MHNHDDGHSHSHGKTAAHKVLMLAIVLTLGFAVVEAFGGWWADSLALLGDAGHMGSDAIALAIAAFAAWVATKPPSEKHSYGYGRAEVIAAWISSLLMLAICVVIIIEAIGRMNTPTHVKGLPVFIIGSIGLLVNLLVAWLLSRGEKTINIRAALLHVMGDILGSLAALISGAVIYATGWLLIDPILSIFISILIIISSLRLLRESFVILMEGVPKHINIDDVAKSLRRYKAVKDVHDLHIWTLSSGRFAMSAHIRTHDLSTWSKLLKDIKVMLEDRFDIDHITLQPEPEVMSCKPCDQP
jgi:cobalt-zinc-cadmium efflux system protein